LLPDAPPPIPSGTFYAKSSDGGKKRRHSDENDARTHDDRVGYDLVNDRPSGKRKQNRKEKRGFSSPYTKVALTNNFGEERGGSTAFGSRMGGRGGLSAKERMKGKARRSLI